MTEAKLQGHMVEAFRYMYAKYRRLLFHIPNGGNRSGREAKKFKRMGVLAGVPDLFLAVPRGEYGGLFIEVKNGKSGTISGAQAEMISNLEQAGYCVKVAHSTDEFLKIVKQYFEE